MFTIPCLYKLVKLMCGFFLISNLHERTFYYEEQKGNNIFGNKASDGLGMWRAMKNFQQLHFNTILIVDVKLSGSNMKNLWINIYIYIYRPKIWTISFFVFGLCVISCWNQWPNTNALKIFQNNLINHEEIWYISLTMNWPW